MNALTMLLALYRIVFAKNFESYSSLLCELLDTANAHGIRLAFREPIAASTFSEARKRFSPTVFKQIAGAINELYEEIVKRGDPEEIAKIVLLTDGSARVVQVGNWRIKLKKTTPKNMATAGRMSGLVIQALRYMKQENIDDRIIKKLKGKLSDEDKKQLVSDLRYAPAWIEKVVRKLQGE